MALARFFTLLAIALLALPLLGLVFSTMGDCLGPSAQCEPYWQRNAEEVSFGMLFVGITALVGVAGLIRSRRVVIVQFVWAAVVVIVAAIDWLAGGNAHPMGPTFPILLLPLAFFVGAAALQLADSLPAQD